MGEAVASKKEQEARRKQNLYLFGGIGFFVVGIGVFVYTKDMILAARHEAHRIPQPWDLP